jgi:hypothetical protein
MLEIAKDQGMTAMTEKIKPRVAYEATDAFADFLPDGSVSIHFPTTEQDAEISVLLSRAVVEKLANQISSHPKPTNA